MITLTLKQKGGTMLQLKRTIHIIIIPAVNKYIPTVVRRGCLIVWPSYSPQIKIDSSGAEHSSCCLSPLQRTT